MANEKIKIYKVQNPDSFVEIALNIDVTYDPINAIHKINDDIDVDSGYNAEDMVGTDVINQYMHPDDENVNTTFAKKTFIDFNDVKDSLDRPVRLYVWETKKEKGFPFIEAHDYDLDEKGFFIKIRKDLDFVINNKGETYRYKPILLIDESEEP